MFFTNKSLAKLNVICACLRIVVSSIYCVVVCFVLFFIVLCTLCCQFLWHFWLSLRYYLAFIYCQCLWSVPSWLSLRYSLAFMFVLFKKRLKIPKGHIMKWGKIYIHRNETFDSSMKHFCIKSGVFVWYTKNMFNCKMLTRKKSIDCFDHFSYSYLYVYNIGVFK